MKRVSTAALVVLSLACPVAIAQVVGFSELQQKGVVQLSAQELRGIAEGAKVSTVSVDSFLQQWENENGGKLAASSRNINANNPRLGYGNGTWRIEDDGQYCVEIAWQRSSMKWCRHIFRSGGKLYSSAESAKPDGKAYEIEFRK